MSNSTYSRQQLYELIWSAPLAQVAAKLGTTAALLRKICFDEDIPVPGYFYWSRSNADCRKPDLLPPKEQDVTLNFPEAAEHAQTALLSLGEIISKLKVPQRLIEPDRLTVTLQTNLRDMGFYQGKEMLWAGYSQLAVRASKAQITRAIRIMDMLVKIWRGRGYAISFEDKETIVRHRGVRQGVSIRELTRKLPGKGRFDSSVYEPTGQLAFRLNGWLDKEWKDGKKALEDQVIDILNHMEVVAQELEHSWAIRAAERAIEEEKRRIREAAIRTEQEERQAFEFLVEEAQRWHQLRILDDYLNELNRNTPRTPEFIEWYTRAKERRRIFDPMYQRIEDFTNTTGNTH